MQTVVKNHSSSASSEAIATSAPPKPAFPPLDHIMQTGLGFWASKTLLSAVELGVFTVLAEGALDAEKLRQSLGLNPRSSRDFFDALVALNLLERRDGQYSNTPATDFYLDRRKATYAGGILEMCNARLYAAWGSLTDGLKSGRSQNDPSNKNNPFETLYSTPERLEEFLSGMTGISLGAAMAIAEKFPWHERNNFVDIGAAQGGVPVQLARSHPHLRGVGFDLPQVRPVFEKYVRSNGVSDRVTFAPGNFFNDPLPSAEVMIMGHILHDWDLQQKRMLLDKAYAALPKGGALIVYEALIDDERRQNALGLLMSLNMLIETPGGFDYTGRDCQTWMREAGFRQTWVQHLVGPDSMVVGIK